MHGHALRETISHLVEAIKTARSRAKVRYIENNPYSHAQSMFQSELSHRISNYVYQLPRYLFRDEITAYVIQPTNRSHNLYISGDTIDLQVQLEYFSEATIPLDNSVQMIMECTFSLNTRTGQLKTNFSNIPLNTQGDNAMYLNPFNGDGFSLQFEYSNTNSFPNSNKNNSDFGTPDFMNIQNTSPNELERINEDDLLWASNIGKGAYAFNIGNSAKTQLLDYTVRTSYKSARTAKEFNKLKLSQKAWRTSNTLGKSGAKYLKYAKAGGKTCVVIGAVTTGAQIYNDWDAGNRYSAGARAAVYSVAAGAALIPVAGWGVSISIGVADMIWGEQFYDWVETKMGD